MLIAAPKLDKTGFFRNIKREGTPSRVFIWEHAVDDSIKLQIAERFNLAEGLDKSCNEFPWQLDVRIFEFLSQEIFRVKLPGSAFPLYEGKWIEEHSGPIFAHEDIDKYPWPKIENVDFSQLDWYESNLPENMGINHTVHHFETVRDLLGFENLCISLFEQPDFVAQVCERVGDFVESLVRTLSDYRCIDVIYSSDDFGFKTSLIIDPGSIRKYFLPWYKKFSDIAHTSNKLFFVHSCGQVQEIMDDLIDDVGMDAKHSFEDVITPVIEAKRLWGDRVALLGGLDVDFVVRNDENAIRQRVRETLDVCLPGGGYCLGMGNWVTSYIPVDNYLAVLDEARRYC